MSPQDLTRERIKTRLLRRSAEIWGVRDQELDGFDPLVNLLIEACAVEFEKVYKEIVFSQNRVLERLANLMVPDVLDTPRPAFGVLQVNPVDHDTTLTPDTQFVLRRSAEGGRGAARPGAPREATDCYFSPLGSHRLFHGRVRTLVHGASVAELDAAAPTRYQVRPVGTPDYQVLWVGLEVGRTTGAPVSLPPLTFFFDWLGEADREAFYQQLPACTWWSDTAPVSARAGLPPDTAAPSLAHEFDPGHRVETQLQAQLSPAFVRVTPAPDQKFAPTNYPPDFENLFGKSDLQLFKQELVWLRVVFPQLQPTDWLASVQCAVNAVPVLNRRLNRLSYRLQPNVNIVPLATDEHFLAVREVRNNQNFVYSAMAAVETEAVLAGSYVLRQRGEGRFNALEAREMLHHLMGLLRDESASFAAVGEDFLASGIRDLDQTIARLEQKMGEEASQSASPYLLLKPLESGDTVFVEYWTTQAAAANRLPAGTRLAVYAGAILDKNEGTLLTATSGGKVRPTDTDKVHAYKRALLTRNRVVTNEDVRALCFDELGEQLRSVAVNRRLLRSTAPGQGYVRCVEVVLTPQGPLADHDWRARCEQLRTTLEAHSVGTLPYRVTVN